jgi:hypothetical protein
MAKATKAKPTRKRRPQGSGKFPMIGLRLAPATTAALDRWGKARGYGSRSAAIRALVEGALAGRGPGCTARQARAGEPS